MLNDDKMSSTGFLLSRVWRSHNCKNILCGRQNKVHSNFCRTSSDESNMATPPSHQCTPHESGRSQNKDQEPVEKLDYQSVMGQLDQQFSQATPAQVNTLVVFMSSVTEKLDSVMHRLKKLDEIDRALGVINTKVEQVDGRVSRLEKDLHESNVTLSELEKGVHFASESLDEMKETNRKLDSDLKDLRNKVKKMDNDREKLQDGMTKHDRSILMLCDSLDKNRKERDDLYDTVLDLQCRSMKNNLVFSGLAGESPDEDTEDKIRSFLHNELGLKDVDKIEFGNVHRFGKYTQGRHRPIVASFLHYRDLERVKRNTYKLKGKPFGVNEQFPPVIENRRKQLYPVMRRLKQEGKRPTLVRDKLYVDGRRYDNLIYTGRYETQRNAPLNHSDSSRQQTPPNGTRPKTTANQRNEAQTVGGSTR